MSNWRITLFGKFNVECDEKRAPGFDALRIQELFSYLLLSKNHPQPRELLSETLWANEPFDRSRKKLRQTLWRLRSALKNDEALSEPILLIDNDCIQINPPPGFWIDTMEFEKVFNLVNGKRIHELDEGDLGVMQIAANSYRGDLLEGWYQDWCFFERERFQSMHLLLLDKIVQYCEFHQKFDMGLTYGVEILRHDHAYERAHCQLMRLYYMTGNRTQALHQYQNCKKALQDELGIEPSGKTKRLYEQIRLDTSPSSIERKKEVFKAKVVTNPALGDLMCRLEEVSNTLGRFENQIHEEIVALMALLSDLG